MVPLKSTLTLMHVKTISAENAAALDKDLMSVGAFSLDQLMELAGLSVSQTRLSKVDCHQMLYSESRQYSAFTLSKKERTS